MIIFSNTLFKVNEMVIMYESVTNDSTKSKIVKMITVYTLIPLNEIKMYPISLFR